MDVIKLPVDFGVLEKVPAKDNKPIGAFWQQEIARFPA
jgi:hypothetical protein